MHSNVDAGAAGSPRRRPARDVTNWVPKVREPKKATPPEATDEELLNALELFQVRRAALDIAQADMVARLWQHGRASSDENEALVREVSIICSVSNAGALRLIGTSLLVHDSHAVRAAVTSGRITLAQAGAIAEWAPNVPVELRERFEHEAVEVVEGSTARSASDRVRQLVDLLAPEGMTARHERAKRTRRTELEPAADGMAWLMLLLEAHDAIAIQTRLTKSAVALHGQADEERCLGELRADVAVDLLLSDIPAATEPELESGERRTAGPVDIVPQVHVMVPVMTLVGKDAPAHLRGYGPIDPETARQLTSQAPSLYRVLVDPVKPVVLDVGREHYDVPPALRRYLQIRDARCRFPGCRRIADLCDIDHVRPWAHDGPTSDDNLAHLCRKHHQVKDEGWIVEIEPDGTMRWTSPYGRTRVTRPEVFIHRDQQQAAA